MKTLPRSEVRVHYKSYTDEPAYPLPTGQREVLRYLLGAIGAVILTTGAFLLFLGWDTYLHRPGPVEPPQVQQNTSQAEPLNQPPIIFRLRPSTEDNPIPDLPPLPPPSPGIYSPPKLEEPIRQRPLIPATVSPPERHEQTASENRGYVPPRYRR